MAPQIHAFATPYVAKPVSANQYYGAITGQVLKDCYIRFRPRTESHNLSCRRLLSCNRKQTLWDSVRMCSGDRYNASNIGLRVLAGRDSKGRYSSHPSRSRAQMKLDVSSNWKRDYVLVGHIRQNCLCGAFYLSAATPDV